MECLSVTDTGTLKDAWVVCKQLGFASVVSATTGSQFGKVPKDFIMNYVHCTGEESSLLNCSHSRYDFHPRHENKSVSVPGRFKNLFRVG